MMLLEGLFRRRHSPAATIANADTIVVLEECRALPEALRAWCEREIAAGQSIYVIGNDLSLARQLPGAHIVYMPLRYVAIVRGRDAAEEFVMRHLGFAEVSRIISSHYMQSDWFGGRKHGCGGVSE